MAIPNITMKFNIFTVFGVVLLLGISLSAIGICFISRGRLFETFQNIVNVTTNNAPDPYEQLKANTAGAVPLPDNELYFFYNNKFDPKCCTQPQHYSSSNGCACMTPEQLQYLNKRGGNHTCEGDY